MDQPQPIWEAIWTVSDQTGQPYADLRIDGEFDLSVLLQVIAKLQDISRAMGWRQADWILASRGSARTSHIIEKRALEMNVRARALCGNTPSPSDEAWAKKVPLLQKPGTYGVCQVCRASWVKKSQAASHGVQP